MAVKKKPQRIEFPAQMALAKQIVRDILDNGTGANITGVLLTANDDRNHGGWGKLQLIDRIYKHLIGELPQ